MTLPFSNSTNFPLNGITYGSRTQSNIDNTKNYVFLGFKPGFPLQASELNEIQENFYAQQTLTSEMIYNWSNLGVSGPGWWGATPIKPQLLDRTGTAPTVTVILSPGWLYVKQPNFMGGMGMWIYNTNTYNYTVPLGQDISYGIAVTLQEVNASSDSSLNDNSGGSRNIYGLQSEGANRIQAVLSSTPYSSLTSGTVPSGYVYAAIFKTYSSATATSTRLTTEVYTINNYKIT